MRQTKTIVCLMMYNRYWNVHRWLTIWSQCEHYGCQLYVIRNDDNNHRTTKRLAAIMENYPQIPVLMHDNAGLDIGAFRDTVRGKVVPDNDWQELIWFVDDAVPMHRNFIIPYMKTLDEHPNTKLAGCEYSNEYKPHIRTNGFIIDRAVAERVEFPEDPISKTRCYEFEHRINSLTDQVLAMGHGVRQIGEKIDDYVWDIGHRVHLNNWERLYREFPDTVQFGEKN
jgi:hypothetical protein